jgi:hypothetical protein
MAKVNMYSGKSLGWRKYQNSPAMKDLLSNSKIASALDKPRARAEFFRDLQGAGNGGVTKNNVKEVLGKYMAGKGSAISRRKAAIIADEMFKGDSKKYILPRNDAVENNPKVNSVSTLNQSSNSNMVQTPISVPGTVPMNSPRISSALAASVANARRAPQFRDELSKEDSERDRGSFSRALAAMTRNKRK